MGTLTVRLVSDPQEVERLAARWLAEHAVDANVLATILASGSERVCCRPGDWA
jgi:hypothetical protein